MSGWKTFIGLCFTLAFVPSLLFSVFCSVRYVFWSIPITEHDLVSLGIGFGWSGVLFLCYCAEGEK